MTTVCMSAVNRKVLRVCMSAVNRKVLRVCMLAVNRKVLKGVHVSSESESSQGMQRSGPHTTFSCMHACLHKNTNNYV